VIIEGPQSEERANAIIAEAKKIIPNKPIKYVVNTHNHFDHPAACERSSRKALDHYAPAKQGLLREDLQPASHTQSRPAIGSQK